MPDDPLLTPSEWDMVIRLVERTAAITSDNWNGPNEWAPIATKLKTMRNECGTAEALPPASSIGLETEWQRARVDLARAAAEKRDAQARWQAAVDREIEASRLYRKAAIEGVWP